MTTSPNLLDGRPLSWGDPKQAKLATATGPNPVYDPRPNAIDLILTTCICCGHDIRIRKRYNAIEEKMQYVTPRIHSCRCGARILLYRYNSPTHYEGNSLFGFGEVVYRHCGAYEPVNELDHIHRHDSWKFYYIYELEKVAKMKSYSGKTP